MKVSKLNFIFNIDNFTIGKVSNSVGKAHQIKSVICAAHEISMCPILFYEMSSFKISILSLICRLMHCVCIEGRHLYLEPLLVVSNFGIQRDITYTAPTIYLLRTKNRARCNFK